MALPPTDESVGSCATIFMETVYAHEEEKVRKMPDARPRQVLGVVPAFHGRRLVAMRS